MLSRSQKVRLGVFLLLGTVLAVGGLAVLAGMSLFRTTDRYTLRFDDSVSGLSSGAAVSLRGVRIGRVDRIGIDPKNYRVVVVKIVVTRGTPIPADSTATMASHGVTGIKFIEIKSGQDQKLFQSGATIPTGKSQIQQLTGKAQDIAVMTEKLVLNLLSATTEKNREEFMALIRAAREFLVSGRWALDAATLLVNDVRPTLKRSLRNFEDSSWVLRRTMRHFDETVVETGRQLRATLVTGRGALDDARGLLGKKGRLVATLNQLDRSVSGVEKRVMGKDISDSIVSARRALIALQLLLTDLRDTVGQVKGNVKPMSQSLRAAAEHLEEFARTLRENPASLINPGAQRDRRLPK